MFSTGMHDALKYEHAALNVCHSNKHAVLQASRDPSDYTFITRKARVR